MARSSWFALALLLLWAPPLRAQELRIAVLPFNGQQGARAQSEIVNLLREHVPIVPPAEWEATAQRLFATSHSAGDIAAVAQAIGAAIVITGAVKREGEWMLIVSVRSGATGVVGEKLRVPMKSARIDVKTMHRVAEELGPAIEKVLQQPAEPPAPVEEVAPPLAEEKAAPPVSAEQPPSPVRADRPEWNPYVESSVGFLLVARQLEFDQPAGSPKLPQFRSVAAPGIRADVTVFPFAGQANHTRASRGAIAGLGVGATFDFVIWPDSIPCQREAAGSPCLMTTERYATREFRLEGGLRWRWNPWLRLARPDLQLSAQFGLHPFVIDKRPDGTDVGPPDVAYTYLSFGAGTRFPITSWLALKAGFKYHLVLGAGPIYSMNEFGPGSGWGIRTDGGAELRVWRWVWLRFDGFYERFGLAFSANPDNPPERISPAASDQYYGGIFSVQAVY